jgi:hypothetical protein
VSAGNAKGDPVLKRSGGWEKLWATDESTWNPFYQLTEEPLMARLAHHVFFTLVDRSDQAIESLLAECKKYLDNHDGLVDFAIGTRDRELAREVNQDFDVALHCVFQDRAAHDAYQVAPRHLQFIEANKENWAQVRVFDSTLE